MSAQRKSQGAFEYILLLGGVLLIVVVSVIIMRGSVLNQANQQLGGNMNVYKFQTCIPQYFTNPESVIAHWKFDESSGTVAKDEKGRTGTLSNFDYTPNSGWVPGRNGNGLKFDGSNDAIFSVGLPSSDFSTQKLTIAAWIKLSSTANQIIFIKNGPMYIYVWDGKFKGSVHGPGWDTASSSSLMKTDEWTHIAMTWDGAAIKAYVNGRLEGTTAHSGSLGSDGCAQIGTFTGYPSCGDEGYRFNGVLDDLVFYNRALSQDEIC